MIRRSRPGDEAGLKHLWHTAFGDPMEEIDGFFREMYRPGMAVLSVEGDVIASAIYLLDAGVTLTADKRRLRTAYSYAMATLPEFRGRGLGKTVSRAAIETSFAGGFDLNVICPAEEGLFAFYRSVGYAGGFSISERRIARGEDCNEFVTNSVMSTRFSDYFLLRPDCLPPFSTRYSPDYLRYVEGLCRSAGGGLYRLNLDNQMGLAAVEKRAQALFIREILLPESLVGQGVQLLMRHLDAELAICRTPRYPVRGCGDGGRPFALMALRAGVELTEFDGYFPFVLD